MIVESILNEIEKRVKNLKYFKTIHQWGILPTDISDVPKINIRDTINERADIKNAREVIVEIDIFENSIEKVRVSTERVLSSLRDIKDDINPLYEIDLETLEFDKGVLEETIATAKLRLNLKYIAIGFGEI